MRPERLLRRCATEFAEEVSLQLKTESEGSNLARILPIKAKPEAGFAEASLASLGFQHRSAPIYRIEAIRSELAAHLGIFRSTNKALDQIEGHLPPLIAGQVGLGYRHHSAHHQGDGPSSASGRT